MPQIWMTYDELATLNGCCAAEARMQAMHLSLDRRKSRDGNTRVKLNLALMARFFETVREAEFDLDDAITALRDAHRQMSGVLSANQPSLRRGVA
ncbi:hypothetical protein JQ636_26350 [Bradyrhizobium japonicum]|uniref:hypothetical protein n=1 Tax=Bradyrhizobium japonicum TaxID=375 RepID=UPI0004B0B369|nr:hypothetical protein [Bradyrhizobium japonicum]MBR0728695.1 hypothetical protein [Bradyrhizobium japonicum]MBR0807076.1 hypothetical protein [Bradyrhizobium japonicum]